MKQSKTTLSKISTKPGKKVDKKQIKKETAILKEEIADLAHTLMAEKKQSILLVLQGMDSSGKDGATKKVFSRCSPHVVKAYPFKKPTDLEFSHDFLWRAHKIAPAKGEIAIWTRSHYEDILIQSVHKWIDKKTVAARMKAINDFEELLSVHNNTKVIKCYLHLSKDRQLEKLQERLDIPEKNWKHNDGDWEERKHWDAYMKAYEYAINESVIPWHIVPVDSRWYRDYTIASIVKQSLTEMNPQYPILPQKNGK